jgi:SAM-dependent methyltransferase
LALRTTFDNELAVRVRERSAAPSELFGDISDDFWLWINTEGYRRSPALREILPDLPEDEVQRHWTFFTGDDTLAEGFGVYCVVRALYERHIGPIGDARSVLDFGCGYGRVIRFFLRDCDHRSLTGTDNNGSLIDFCRESNRWCEFVQNDDEPPLPFEDGRFDYVFAFSVFSHFSEAMHMQWLKEFKRVVRPGGAVAISFRPRDWIKHLRKLRESGTQDESPILLKMLVDTDRELSRYDAGEFCFSPYSTQVHPWLGEACIPRAYIEDEWSRLFEVVEFFDGSPLNLDGIRESPHPASDQHFVLLRR